MQILIRMTVSAILAISFAKLTNAQCGRYTIEVIHPAPCGILGIPNTVGLGINEQGWIAGYHRNCNADERAFGWFGAPPMVTLSLPPSTPSSGYAHATDISDSGEIVGWTSVGSAARKGFRFQSGIMTLLESLPGATSNEAYSINAAGSIVGFSHMSGGLQAVRWDEAQPILLGVKIGPKSKANDINDLGQIVGWMGIDPGPSFGAEAFLWEKGVTTGLGFLPDGVGSNAKALNNLGTVVGTCFIPAKTPSGWRRTGFIWDGKEMTPIGELPLYRESYPEDINDAGQIVGWCDGLNEPSVPPAFIWQNGVMKSLAELCPDAPINITRAYAINNKGQITGSGINPQNRTVAYILSPPKRSPGDFNCDGIVNVDDLLGLLSEWGPVTPGMHADFNNDGLINVDDLVTLLGNWSF